MTERKRAEDYCRDFRVGEKRDAMVRILKPGAYVAYYDLIEAEDGEARKRAMWALSSLLPNGLGAFVVDARSRRSGKGKTAVEIVCMERDAWEVASEGGKTRLFTVESLIPRSEEADYLIEMGDAKIRVSCSGGVLLRRSLLLNAPVGAGIGDGSVGGPDAIVRIGMKMDVSAAQLPESFRPPVPSLSFKKEDKDRENKAKMAFFAAAVVIPVALFAAMASIRIDVFARRYDSLQKAYVRYEKEALAFSQAEKAIQGSNSIRLRNEPLKKVLSSILGSFSRNGAAFLSFSFDGASFRVTGSGGKPLDILKSMDGEGSMDELRLMEAGNGSAAKEFSITGKLSK